MPALRALALLVIGPWALADSPLNIEDSFASTYNIWIHLREAEAPGTIDAHELQQWNLVKRSWSELAHHVDAREVH